MIKSRVEEEAGQKKRSGTKGIWMEMLMLQPSLEPELCIGKTAPDRLCSVWSPLCSILLVPFSKGWESTIKLTSLSSVAFQKEISPKGMFQAFNFLIFLGSKKYLLPQFLLSLVSGQNVFHFGQCRGQKWNNH